MFVAYTAPSILILGNGGGGVPVPGSPPPPGSPVPPLVLVPPVPVRPLVPVLAELVLAEATGE